MDRQNAAELTQLDEMCLICLTDKFRHYEHCAKCNRCVKGWHFHSNFFNTCFGERNMKAYVIY